MDSLFGIGLPELLVILLIAGIVMGPERIAHAARWLGRTTAQLQGISRAFFRQLNAEIDAVDSTGDLRGAMDELAQLRREVATLRAEFTGGAIGGTVQETRTALNDVKQEAERTIAPPRIEPAPPVNKAAPYKIPSLAPANGNTAGERTASGNNIPPPPPLLPLPNRVEISDDPDE